jgi:hypothetical protein
MRRRTFVACDDRASPQQHPSFCRLVVRPAASLVERHAPAAWHVKIGCLLSSSWRQLDGRSSVSSPGG